MNRPKHHAGAVERRVGRGTRKEWLLLLALAFMFPSQRIKFYQPTSFELFLIPSHELSIVRWFADSIEGSYFEFRMVCDLPHGGLKWFWGS